MQLFPFLPGVRPIAIRLDVRHSMIAGDRADADAMAGAQIMRGWGLSPIDRQLYREDHGIVAAGNIARRFPSVRRGEESFESACRRQAGLSAAS